VLALVLDELSGQFHVLAALPTGDKLQVLTAYEAGNGPQDQSDPVEKRNVTLTCYESNYNWLPVTYKYLATKKCGMNKTVVKNLNGSADGI
jgi:hypothetical protein